MSDSSTPAARTAAPRSGTGPRRAVRAGALQAARLARWAGPDTRVDAGGGLVEEQLPTAAEELGLSGDDAAARERGMADRRGHRAPSRSPTRRRAPSRRARTSRCSPAAPRRTCSDCGSPPWRRCSPTRACPTSTTWSTRWPRAARSTLSSLDWDPEAEAEFLDSVLGNLYLLTVGEDRPGDASVPLPALAASVIVPSDMGEPTNDVLEQVSDAMMRLDDQFRLLEPIGLVEYQPVDEALMADADEEPRRPSTRPTSPATAWCGSPRSACTGLRARLLEAGFEAPAVGDLSDKGADALLDGTAPFPPAAYAETELWLAGRSALVAARELLAAARGSGHRRAPAPAALPAGAVPGRHRGGARVAGGPRRRRAGRPGPGLADRARCAGRSRPRRRRWSSG